jgi:hydroxymethylpyrimidine/phosphomethylpyrimidine kinase
VALTQHAESVFAKSVTNRVVLTVAGSDSSGGAGAQLDLRTFASFGTHGVSAITAVTAQSGRNVRSIHCVPSTQLTAQLDAIADEFDIAAVKIGMLGTAANVRAVARFIFERRLQQVVLDPVLVATSGASLLSRDGLDVLRRQLIPLAHVLTPNLPEAAALLGHRVSGARGAATLLALGARSVVLKGGHGRGSDVVDYFADGARVTEFRHARLPFNARGTGCALSAAIAARLALGDPLENAVRFAEDFLQNALQRSRARGRSGKHLLLVDPIDK